jgi:hypothetical protein
MLQPARVLLSNAPPLRGGSSDNSVVQASRVLQEQSGNRQLNDHNAAAAGAGHGSGYDLQQKYLAQQQTSPTENAWPNSSSAHSQLPQGHQQYYNVPTHLHHPQPQYRQQWTYAQHRRPSGAYYDEQVISHRARQLWLRFQRSESYKKYRDRQHKDDKAAEQKWPDHLEEAFFRGMHYPNIRICVQTR